MSIRKEREAFRRALEREIERKLHEFRTALTRAGSKPDDIERLVDAYEKKLGGQQGDE